MRKFCTAAAALLLGAGLVSAGTINIVSDPTNSTENLGRFTGVLDYDSGVLKVTLTNTTPQATGGFITGFLFNINDDNDNALAVYVDADDAATAGVDESNFDDAGGDGGSPFGSFETGAALGGNFLGGGNPNPGVGIGETGVFTFSITDDETLSVEDFFSEARPGQGGNAKQAVFVVRFRGMSNDGSDKVPGIPHETPVIPLPAAVWTGMLMLGGLGGKRLLSRRAR